MLVAVALIEGLWPQCRLVSSRRSTHMKMQNIAPGTGYTPFLHVFLVQAIFLFARVSGTDLERPVGKQNLPPPKSPVNKIVDSQQV